MIKDKTITLFCLSTDNPIQSIKVMKHCYSVFPYFDEIKLLSSYSGKEDKIEIVEVANVKSYKDYNTFMVESLDSHIDTDFCLIVQADGYILNPQAWDDNFLNYDYIGAPWPPFNNLCGNGGFSLRSKRIITLASKLKNPTGQAEDVVYCRRERDYFTSKGMIFSDPVTGARFSHESGGTRVVNTGLNFSFGFHGKHHMNSVPVL